MGDLRVLVEAALREISTLLFKAKVSEMTQREVRQRFLRLLGELAACEETAARGNPEPPRVFCGDIVQDVVNRAVNVLIPKRQANLWEMRSVQLQQQLLEKDMEIAQCVAKANELQGEIDRRDAAHHYVMNSYFREVFLLRRDKEAVANERDAFANALVASSNANVASSGNAPYSVGAPSPTPMTKIPTLRSGSAGSRFESPLAAGGRPPSAPTPAAPHSTPARPQLNNVFSSISVTPVNPDAIFDYEKYLQLFSSASADLTHRYTALMAEHKDYVTRSGEEREAMASYYKGQIDLRDKKIEVLLAANERNGSLLAAARDSIAVERVRIKADRDWIAKTLQTTMHANRVTNVDVYTILEALRLQETLIVGYVAKAAKLIVAEASLTTTPEAESAARAEFQAALMPVPGDPDQVRYAKLYLRRHDVASEMLAAIVAVKKNITGCKEVSRRMHILGQYSLKENAERLRAAKILNDIKLLGGNDNEFQFAAIAEAARLSIDKNFMRRLYSAADDESFQMHDSEREMILEAYERQRVRVADRVRAIFHRVRNRVAVSRIRYVFELRHRASVEVDENLPTAIDVKDHVDRVLALRERRIQRWTTEHDRLDHDMVDESTRLVTSISAELMWRVLHWIRRRSQALIDPTGEGEEAPPEGGFEVNDPSGSTAPRAPVPPKTGGSSARTKLKAAMSSVLATTGSSHSFHGRASNGPSEVETALRAQVDELQKQVEFLQLQIQAMSAARRLRDDGDDDEIGFRVAPAPLHLPNERFIPTMGGIGTTAAQKKSIETLKASSHAEVGSAHVTALRRPPSTPSRAVSTPKSSPRRR